MCARRATGYGWDRGNAALALMRVGVWRADHRRPGHVTGVRFEAGAQR
jgi:hypothetical protein